MHGKTDVLLQLRVIGTERFRFLMSTLYIVELSYNQGGQPPTKLKTISPWYFLSMVHCST